MNRKVTTLSYANFPKTFDRKYSRSMGQKLDDDKDTGFLLSAILRALFQTGGKSPIVSEELNNLIKKGAMTGIALAQML